ncbi:hypothetical protein ES707_10117 [subsurface metagenome]
MVCLTDFSLALVMAFIRSIEAIADTVAAGTEKDC